MTVFKWIVLVAFGVSCLRRAVHAYELAGEAAHHFLRPPSSRQRIGIRPQAVLSQRDRSAVLLPRSHVQYSHPYIPAAALLNGSVDPARDDGPISENVVEGFVPTAQLPAGDLAAANSGIGGQALEDHKILGARMELFSFPKPRVGSLSGLGPAFLPKGHAVLLQLQDGIRKLQGDQGFQEARTHPASCQLLHVFELAPCQSYLQNCFASILEAEKWMCTYSGSHRFFGSSPSLAP